MSVSGHYMQRTYIHEHIHTDSTHKDKNWEERGLTNSNSKSHIHIKGYKETRT